jgi:protein PhnA
VKGTSVTLKRGTLIKNITLTGNEGEIECWAEKVVTSAPSTFSA